MTKCAFCKKELTPTRRRPKKFCDDNCKARFYYKTKPEVKEQQLASARKRYAKDPKKFHASSYRWYNKHIKHARKYHREYEAANRHRKDATYEPGD